MDQLFIFILVGAFALMKWLASGKGGKVPRRGAGQHTTSAYGPIEQPRMESETERLRRFMEALGVPQGTAVPSTRAQPPAKRPATRTHRSIPAETLPPAPPTPIPSAMKMEKAAVPVFETVIDSPENAYIPPTASKTVSLTEETPRAEVRRFLRSGDSLRHAVVLREILGPPRSLQSSP